MSDRCKHIEKSGFNCGSYAFNLYKDGIDQGNLCDVHYWQAKALAQPEQEPVAWINEHGHIDCGLDAILDPTGWTPLYTAPPQPQPVAYWKEHAQGLQRDYDSLLADFQAQLKERNFCPRCGKRTKDIHTCTPPQD